MKKVFKLIFLFGILLFILSVIFTFTTINKQVEKITFIATSEFDKEAVESLIDLVKDDSFSYSQKNTAIWALGQYADERSLSLLEQLNSETEAKEKYDRNTELSKYEIEKAIKWCKNGNLTGWMY